jgi:signal transduction histidine kinase/CheY-like chemotaxis protein
MWWIHTRRLAQQRQRTRTLYALSEQIVAAPSPLAIAERLAETLPALLDASSTDLYLFNRNSKALSRVVVPMEAGAPGSADAAAVDLTDAIAACFRNRALLAILDTRVNSLVQNPGGAAPRSALLVPLVSHEEGLGVIAIGRAERTGAFRQEEQASAQHLANQVASALKLQEQRLLQEQLFRGEKLAAAGQMIAGIAEELRAPLTGILHLNQELLGLLKRRDDIPAVERGMEQMASDSARAQEIITRLTAFSREDHSMPRELDLGGLLQKLAGFREPLWKEQGLAAQKRFDGGPLPILGAESQLEQVFLTLLMHVEQRASKTAERSVTVKTSDAGGRARVEIGFLTPPGVEPEEHDGSGAHTLSLGVCKGIVENHSGEWKVHHRAGVFAFEVTLPRAGSAPEAASAPVAVAANGRALTLMLVDAEPAASRPLLKMLNSRGHRVVPVAGEEAAELAPRLRFDAVFWNARSGRASWGEFLERVRASINSFVVVSDGYNRDLAASLEQNGGFLLARPVDEGALDRILTDIGSRAARQ